MPDTRSVAAHYTHGGLLEAIRGGVEEIGKTPETVLLEDLGPVDEFHIGGRVATEGFLDRIDLKADDHVLDVGCGLGGASRLAAKKYSCQVTGIDLTIEYVETGNVLCSWLGLEESVSLAHGDATATGHPDHIFDKAYMLHVGMNIADKFALALELHRVLKPGGTLGIYDVMRVGDGQMTYPVPWASNEEGSAVSTPAEYKGALQAAGFRILSERNRREFALDFFAGLESNASSADGPPPLGLHILMGETAPTKIRNMIENVSENRVAPFELIAENRA
jgi:ubiquinone/menaquinone biosynthesis C-methylase UbiE